MLLHGQIPIVRHCPRRRAFSGNDIDAYHMLIAHSIENSPVRFFAIKRKDPIESASYRRTRSTGICEAVLAFLMWLPPRTRGRNRQRTYTLTDIEEMNQTMEEALDAALKAMEHAKVAKKSR